MFDLLNKFTFGTDNVDKFFEIWIKLLGHLKYFHENASDNEVSKNIDLTRLPTAAKASTVLFNAFGNMIVNISFPRGDEKFFQELKVVVQIETINKIILADKPTSTSLSIFLGDNKNWAKLSEALNHPLTKIGLEAFRPTFIPMW